MDVNNYSWLPQSFRLAAPKERMRLALPDGLANQLGIHRPQELVRLLTVPFKAHERRHQFSFFPKLITARANQPTKTGEPQPAPILNLPVEIVQMIFGLLDDVEDQMSFGLTCTCLWYLALPAMHNTWVSNMGLWAGKNIVLVGSHTKSADYPPGLFSEEEKAALMVQDTFQLKLFQRKRYLSLAEVAKRQYSEDQQPYECDPLHNFLRCLLRGLPPRGGLEDFNDAAVVARLRDLDELDEKDFYPTEERWILRNLTTKQYVRAEGIAFRPEYIHGPRIEGVGFGHAVMTRICWSSSTKNVMNTSVKLTRGVWAGHRFDITTVTKHEEATKGEEWTDVSQEVADEMNVIYTARFGANWKKFFMDNPMGCRDSLMEARPGWYKIWDIPPDEEQDDY
ncbi:uncharacterized protein F4807DRAFT_108725 [Annulohypoxylon truncatum]|uniref:uncharacterized protein n=1 Tax=Annulohypoxylon truncatum TaxID=327061 RepID=UPI0020073002|nr:uncharacterized protein F4807DRAFT_108725 [Annulohypoxylon truncatum]KAI1209052.1 hypothetical protein F4807DRAFT_108725 [Annulohypoxylon truncatum]